jgi:hypothetical protein
MLFRTRSLAFVVLGSSVLAAWAFGGCGGDGGSGGSAGAGGGTTTDGKYHPTPNGQHVSEKAACDQLTNEQGKLLLGLGCVGTGQTCPAFLRSQFTTACMEYDQGSVDGCIAYYNQQNSCNALKNAIDTCVVTPYPGTEPAGCPTGTGGTGGTGGSTTTTTSMGGTGGTGGTGGSTTTTTTSMGGTGGTGGSTTTSMGGGMMSGSSSSGM